ncbi:UNVERIFIED_CONTAM: hypothetical protein HDU68_006940, partial [Siphonaria sp. JEL0065]
WNGLTGDIPPEIGGLVNAISLRIHLQSGGVKLGIPPQVSALVNLVSCTNGQEYDAFREYLPDNNWVPNFMIPDIPEEDDDSEEVDSGESDDAHY